MCRVIAYDLRRVSSEDIVDLVRPKLLLIVAPRREIDVRQPSLAPRWNNHDGILITHTRPSPHGDKSIVDVRSRERLSVQIPVSGDVAHGPMVGIWVCVARSTTMRCVPRKE